jgi:hypothetical protein
MLIGVTALPSSSFDACINDLKFIAILNPLKDPCKLKQILDKTLTDKESNNSPRQEE